MAAVEVNTYPPGNQLVITGTITDGNGAAFDPPTAIYHVTDSQGTKTTYTFGVDDEITNPAVGEYVLTLLVPYDNAEGGDWFYGLQALNVDGQSIAFTRNLFQVAKTGTL